jgi:hypothetical protein
MPLGQGARSRLCLQALNASPSTREWPSSTRHRGAPGWIEMHCDCRAARAEVRPRSRRAFQRERTDAAPPCKALSRRHSLFTGLERRLGAATPNILCEAQLSALRPSHPTRMNPDGGDPGSWTARCPSGSYSPQGSRRRCAALPGPKKSSSQSGREERRRSRRWGSRRIDFGPGLSACTFTPAYRAPL